MSFVGKYINALSEEDKKSLDAIIIEKALDKKELLSSKMDLNNVAIYIVKGILRKFVIKDGNEKTIDLYFEDDIFFSPSTDYQPVYPFYLQAIQASEIYLVDLSTFNNTKKEHLPLVNLELQLMEEVSKQTQRRLETFQLLDASERYLELLTKNPKIIEKVPLIYVASYLGINNASLSKIRASIK